MNKNNDLHCPECDSLISFKNIIGYEKDEIKIIGMVYAIECQNCQTQFVTPLRIGEDADSEQMREIKKIFDNEFRKVKKKKNGRNI